MPPPKPQIDYEQELKIVRKFLRRNNINDLMLAISPWGVQAHVVRVVGYSGNIPNNHNASTLVSFSKDIDTDGYFDPEETSRLTVPQGLGGNYFIHAEIRWLKTDPRIEWDLNDHHAGMFYSHIALNDSGGLVESSRATNCAVPTSCGTTQICLAEIELAEGDYLQLPVNQNVHDQVQVNAWLTMRMVGP